MTLSDWKSLPITQEIMAEIKNRQEFAKEELGSGAGRDPFEYAYRVGAIAAYQDMLDIQMDEEAHGN